MGIPRACDVKSPQWGLLTRWDNPALVDLFYRCSVTDNLSIIVVWPGVRQIFTKSSRFPISVPTVGAGRQLRSLLGGVPAGSEKWPWEGGVCVSKPNEGDEALVLAGLFVYRSVT